MNIIEAITDVFSSIAGWIPDAISSLTPVFWLPETGLTFMGTLAVAGLAVSIVFLMMGIIQRFLHFGG